MSDWKRGAAERRDERHTAVDDTPRPVAGRKDCKRWCRGKVGVEHKPVCHKRPESYLSEWRELRCEVCGRRLDYWTGPKWSNKPRPPWVDR
jgi:hypothetical protein